MFIYVILVVYILIGQLLMDAKVMSRKSYCISVCLLFILISGLRDKNVGMWDTVTVYLPSFKVIQSHSVPEILAMADTQYKFIGFVLYSKLIAFISADENFYIFMMAWPFYVCVVYLIRKWSRRPGFSFIVLLGFGYFTYSFSMIRGMLALAFCALALDAAIECKWRKFLVFVALGASCHITALVFVMVYPIKKIKWTMSRILTVFVILSAFHGILPVLWRNFVTTFIRGVLPTYNYYGSLGGTLAAGMLVLYILTGLGALVKLRLAKGKMLPLQVRIPRVGFGRHKKKKKAAIGDELDNLLMGMSVVGSVLIFMTSVLSEMMRIAMFFALGSVLLMGRPWGDCAAPKNKVFIRIVELGQAALLIAYFFMAALSNMNALPYRFFF